jgi:hypothetical protein
MPLECNESWAGPQLSAVVSIQRDMIELLDRLDKMGLCLAAIHMSTSLDAVTKWIEGACEAT